MQYWIDYVHQFGVDHKVPLYDHMSFIKYHNIDVWGAAFLILYIAFNIIYYIFACICGLCCKKKESNR